MAAADRVDRRQVEHVETHGADRRQAADDVVEAAMVIQACGLRARKQFVPGAEGGGGAFHLQRQQQLAAGQEFVRIGALHQRRGGIAEQDAGEQAIVVQTQFPLQGFQAGAIGAGSAAPQGGGDHLPAQGDFRGERLARGVLLLDDLAESCPRRRARPAGATGTCRFAQGRTRHTSGHCRRRARAGAAARRRRVPPRRMRRCAHAHP